MRYLLCTMMLATLVACSERAATEAADETGAAMCPCPATAAAPDEATADRALELMAALACAPAADSADPAKVQALMTQHGFTAESFSAASAALTSNASFADDLAARTGACPSMPAAPSAPAAPTPPEAPTAPAQAETPPAPAQPAVPPSGPDLDSLETAVPPPTAGCTAKEDCKGARVCREGRCMDP